MAIKAAAFLNALKTDQSGFAPLRSTILAALVVLLINRVISTVDASLSATFQSITACVPGAN